jgi:hypothetical protein
MTDRWHPGAIALYALLVAAALGLLVHVEEDGQRRNKERKR